MESWRCGLRMLEAVHFQQKEAITLEERGLTGSALRDFIGMAYGVGQTIEVCLEFDMPPAQGVRLVVATFVNERGDVAELTDMPSEVSECFLQKPKQTSLQGRAACSGFYELRRLRVEHLWGVLHVDLPGIDFEVRGTSEVVGWRLS